MGIRRAARRRTLAIVIATALGASVLSGFTGEPTGEPTEDAPDRPTWVGALGGTADPGGAAHTRRAPVPWQPSTSAPLGHSNGTPAARFAFPQTAAWQVRLGKAGEAAEPVVGASGHRSTGPTPVQMSTGADWAAGGSLRVEVLDRGTAARVGASGFVFTVSNPTDGSAGAGGRSTGGVLNRADESGALPAQFSIDYAGFADAYGAGYADRLQVVALPDCAAQHPVPVGCDLAGVPLPVHNDRTAHRLVADVADLAGLARSADPDRSAATPRLSRADLAGILDQPSAGAVGAGSTGSSPSDDQAAAVFAVTSSTGGEEGNFAATPLSIAGTWQVAPGSGEFSYSYPIDLPAPAGGSPPSLSLGYSSASIDGLTLASNTQASPTGLGWSDFANAFIERRYEPCFRNVGTADLCWKSDNATISLAGVAGPLIPVNAAHSEWRVQNDPGWKIERLTGAPYTTIYQQQYWKVTGPDGTVYYFGYGHMPGRQTNSILAVPVLADNSGEPCRTADDKIGSCDQGWRWYLDRVVDPDGNVQSLLYERETNWYSAIGGLAPNTAYHRAGLLKEIIYGGRGWDANNYAARVTFGLQWRCGFLVANCPAPDAGNGGSFVDVPNDLICTQSASCTIHAPSFFTGRRYASARVDVKVGTEWKPVAQHNLYHSFGDGQNGVARKLQVQSIQHAAIAFGKLNAYPDTRFEYVFLDNRADNGGIVSKAMRHNRISRITNPFGGATAVSYGRNRACDGTYNPWPRWDLNVRDCFPQSVKDGSTTRTGIFNKYLVTKVVEVPGGGSPDMTTSYTYEGDPAWAFDTSAFARDEDETGWSRWRGYGTTTLTRGTSKTRLRVFRGWDQDLMLVQDANGDWVPLGHRSVPVSTFDGSASYPDDHALAGRTLEEQRLGTIDAVTDSVLQSRRHEYEKRTTVDPGPDFLFDAEWVGLSATIESVATAPGVLRQRRSQTTYNEHFQPTTTLEEGWLDRSGDERCSITTYADNAGAGMYVYPAVNKKVAGTCASTQVLSMSETYYDGSTVLGGSPVRGNPTRQRTLIEGTRWSETTTDFDDLGRPVRVTDPNGAATTTAYAVTANAPSTQIPIRTTVTNALGHQQITDWIPEFAVASREQDANGNVTEYGYDEFGRLETVWLPTEPLAFAEPSWRFSYDIPNRAVRSHRLVSDSRCCDTAVFEDTWVIYDGLWRERQEQGRSTASDKVLVSETTYDSRGLLRDETVEQALTGTPGAYLPGGSSWHNRTRHGYDDLGREVRKEWFRDATVAHATTTSYGADSVTVTGPDGRQVRERVDGLGRTVAIEEYDGQNWVTSNYGYDLADRLVSVLDPAGNRISYTYNLVGWRTSQQDPNRGSATFGYDNAGNQTSLVDAVGGQIHSRYDALGRQVERRSGAPTGPLLASWQYDTAPGGKGELHREITHTAAGDWVSEAVGYDAKGRVTGNTLVVPAGIAGLSGSYTVSQTYDRADRVRSVTYPAMGGLPQETVTTDYNDLGLATRVAGLAEYVWGASYDDRGRKVSVGFGPRPNGATWMAKTWTYDADQRINGAETFVAGSSAPNGVVSDHELAFDPAGNLRENLTRQNGQAWRECFGYDARSRLASAYTVTAGTACADGTPGTGDRPYVQSYQYSPDGRMLSRVQNAVSTAYTYPAPGAARPHAPTRVGNDAYSWDAKGNLVSRTVAGRTESLSWDVENQLQSVTGPDGTTTFVYDPAGQRLLRRTPDGGATLYVAGHEVTANADGSSVSAVRPYTFDGQLVAVRTPAGVQYLVSDAAGSVELAVPSGGVPSASRAYEPYGVVRAQTGAFPTGRGFVGQVEDGSTRLSYLNARYYDATIGVFISTDELYDTSTVKTMNPYSYSVNNPTTFADPTGAYSAYTWGLEMENSKLREQNKQLIAHIGRLNNHIEELQGIIRKQQKYIHDLLTYIDALEAEIARQAAIIHRLEERVAYLEHVVAVQQREISRLRGIVAYQQRVIRYQAGVIRYQRGVIVTLAHIAFGNRYRGAAIGMGYAGRGTARLVDVRSGGRWSSRGIRGWRGDWWPDCLAGKNPNGSCRGSSAVPWSHHAQSGHYCIFGGGSNSDGGCHGAGIVAPALGTFAGTMIGLGLDELCGPICAAAGGFIVGQWVEDRWSDLRDRCGGWGGLFNGTCKFTL